MKTLKTIFLAALLALPGVTFAGAPWTFVDLGYLAADSGDERTDGVSLRGSIGFAGMWHAGAGYLTADVAGGKSKPGGADVDGYNIYVGLHPAVTDSTDLVLDLGYEALEADGGGGSTIDTTDVFLRAGPRALLAGDKLELSAYLILAFGEDEFTSSVTEDFTDIRYQVGGQYYFNEAWSVGADANIAGS
ncbi:MAG: hypothetical protein ACN4GT_05995, partial [Gammaproteobacteria bacterium]